jgi:flagellar secretion chaperone FliS
MAYPNSAYSNTVYSNFNRYLETEVLSADPVQLICLLYRGAIEATAAARRHLAARQIKERSRQIMRALAILRELARSLDPQYEEISRPLRELYAYMQARLLEANARQIDPPLAEVEQLLSTLLEGWKTALPVPPPSPPGNTNRSAARTKTGPVP